MVNPNGLEQEDDQVRYGDPSARVAVLNEMRIRSSR